jgi:ADP-ribose pyrophosphatase YjhB (NUDIX family)
MTSSDSYRYCPHCATPLTPAEKGGRMRMVCPACGFIHYSNPTAGVATVILDGDNVLLGRRSPASSYAGTWCIPCGHVEWDEDIREAARRECREETGLDVRVGEVAAVHSNFHNPAQHTVGVWFFCEITGGIMQAGDDLDRIAWFSLNDLPQPLAFPTDELVLAQLRRSLFGG